MSEGTKKEERSIVITNKALIGLADLLSVALGACLIAFPVTAILFIVNLGVDAFVFSVPAKAILGMRFMDFFLASWATAAFILGVNDTSEKNSG